MPCSALEIENKKLLASSGHERICTAELGLQLVDARSLHLDWRLGPSPTTRSVKDWTLQRLWPLRVKTAVFCRFEKKTKVQRTWGSLGSNNFIFRIFRHVMHKLPCCTTPAQAQKKTSEQNASNLNLPTHDIMAETGKIPDCLLRGPPSASTCEQATLQARPGGCEIRNVTADGVVNLAPC